MSEHSAVKQVSVIKLHCANCGANKNLMSSQKYAWQTYKNSRQSWCMYCDAFMVHRIGYSEEAGGSR